MSGYEAIVAGKRVQFRERIPARVGYKLPRLLGGIVGDDFESFVPALCVCVEKWDFDGDPASPESYGELDLFAELAPLIGAFTTYVQGVAADLNPKRSGSASISLSGSTES